MRLADLARPGPRAPVASLREVDPDGERTTVVDLRAWAARSGAAPAGTARERPDESAPAGSARERPDESGPDGYAARVVELAPDAPGRRRAGARTSADAVPRDGSRGTGGSGPARRRPGTGPRVGRAGGPASSPNSPAASGLGDDADERGADHRTRSAPGAASDGTRARRARRERGGQKIGAAPPGGPEADPVAVAREICLRLLTERARTRQELAQALRKRGVPDTAAHTVLERFDEVGLIDDAAFAGQWVRSRHTRRGLARRAIAVELRRKGVADEVAQEALAEVDTAAEERRARELVDRKLRTVASDTPERRAAAARRLVGMLARRGYPGEIAYRVVREALAALGAEDDELGPEPDI